MAGDFFKTADGKNVQYVATRKPNTRRLYHSDVMPYNPGGPRINVGAKFFVKQEYDIEVPTKTGTKTVSGTPKTAMAVRLEEESVAAVTQLNNIVDWVNSKLGTVPKTLDETYEALRGFAEDTDFRRLLDENSEWNIHIQTMDDLIEFFSENMLDPRKKFNVANDGGPIGDLTKTYLPGIDPAMSFGDSYRVMAPRRLGRRDKPLIEYGGDPIRTVGSIESLEKSVLRNAAKKTEMTYLSAAVNGLVKSIIVVEKRAAKGLDNHVLRNAKDLSSLQGLTLKAKLSRLTEMIDTSTVKGQKLMLEADKILWRMNQEVPTQRAWNAVKNYIGDWAYKKNYTKALNWADRYSTDPIQVAQGYVFDMVLGAFAWDQFLVQSSQIFNTVALSPIHGTKSAALYGPARYLLVNGRPEVMAQWGRWLQPVTGLTPEQFTEALLMLKQDGRLITNLSVAELGEDIAWTGGFNKAREAGRVFFNEGELVARITAHMTAYMEWTAKNAGPATSQEGRRWISLRQDKLTQAMTYASRSPFQNVPMTQFLSYTWRMTEQLFAGSLGGKAVLSGAEKARLVGAHVLLFGAAGVPAAGWVADRAYYRYGVDVPEEYWSGLRYGMLDVALGTMLGEGTAMSSRLAWGEGLTNTIRQFWNQDLVGAIGGPTLSVLTNTVDYLMKAVKGLVDGTWEQIRTDLNLAARQFKSYEMSHNIYTAYLLGKYYSRTGGGVVDDDVTAWESVAMAFGIPLEDIVETRILDTMSYGDSQWERRQAKRWETLTTEAVKQLELGDTEAYETLINQVLAMRAAVAMDNPAQAQRIERLMPNGFNSIMDEAFQRATERMFYNMRGDQ
jgi:hypothetical protein